MVPSSRNGGLFLVALIGLALVQKTEAQIIGNFFRDLFRPINDFFRPINRGFRNLFRGASSNAELRAAGYINVSNIRLMFMKPRFSL